MNPYSSLSPALTHQQFYVLLALSKGDMHGYAIRGAVGAGSLGTVQMDIGTTYRTLKRMQVQGHIEQAGVQVTGKQEMPRKTYRVSAEGTLRLKDELKRMKFAVESGENAGLMHEEVPADIQRILNELK